MYETSNKEKVFYVIRCVLRDPNYLLLTLQCEHVLNSKQSLFGPKNTNIPPRNTGSSVNTFSNTFVNYTDHSVKS